MPPLSERLIPRERLESHIARLIASHELVVVSATAGGGKTTAVVRSLARLDLPVAWLTLDPSDRAPGRLLAYLEGAIATCVPEASGVARAAMASRVPHADATGLLLEAVGATPLVLVLDELDRIQPSDRAWNVIETVARYAPDAMKLVVISRRAVQFQSRPSTGDRVAWVVETDLAFDAGEVQQVLDLARSELPAQAVMDSTAGWVTGVVFEAWRARDPSSPPGGGSDPLHGYLATQILGELPVEDQRFLVLTSVLYEVTAERAAALGVSDGQARLASLRQANLPAVWTDGGRTLRCHSRFREYLLSRLEEEDPEVIRELHRALGRLLAAQGLSEESVEAFLKAGAITEAAESAIEALPRVVERLDFDVGDRWLAALKALERPPAALIETELTIAAARDDFHQMVAIADALKEAGRLTELIANSERAAAMIAWAYLHAGRLRELGNVLDVAPAGPEMQAIRYTRGLFDPAREPDPPTPPLTGGPLDALVLRGDYIYGRLDRMLADPPSRWFDAVVTPWRIAAFRALGQVSRASELLDQVRASGVASLGLWTMSEPEVLLDGGRYDDAWDMVQSSAAVARKKGSELFFGVNRCIAAKIALLARRDARLALRILGDVSASPVKEYTYVDDLLRIWRGYALLELGRDEEALADLETVVANMTAGGRLLELPTAAVHCAEARWRCGDEKGSDEATDLALEASRQLGSVHLFLQAAKSFPAVLSRRLDAEPGADTAWHGLARSLQITFRPADRPPPTSARVELKDLGRPKLLVDGTQAQVRISKTLELLSFLLLTDEHRASREELLNALFDGRADTSARSYLRTAIHWLKSSLPEDVAVEATANFVALGNPNAIRSESIDALQLLNDAGRLQGIASLRATSTALAVIDQGEFLAGCESAWAVERRREIDARAADARQSAAELSYANGQLAEALALTDQILETDRYREAVWRLRMRILGVLGDEDGVIDSYGRCRAALGELGAEVAPSTSRLLDALRR